ncbi:Ankyrin repeat-containing protein C105,02c OS=Schizosaccharomyces pombe (strain 972 / ATCC 24843) GN=SPAC105.02c PE=4 SV=1 [Rhizoctonia solani AG-1 IB]|uniref:Ankyrin repeat-containing protein C105,02c n=1 Tax=Thanatephorus cucumeris (strain AG1-IB / isolate 7/3/14) TaxID=1108050 RepID=A0A0B7FJ44_THACB|nr:Ankyrin repeat-containing protein C105,02c OS=Schizosaccharomyces pombe (strain 972 / ATCC 24843) GN=SPAC105.02c PE=4 SV=1 [Rhizoctonia solani AG-1 IB]
MADEGASLNERILSAAKTDSVSLFNEIIEEVSNGKPFDINHQDGLGNTALHYAAQNASTLVLEKILEYEHPLHEGEGGCDVDLQNRIYGYTPLHLAVRIEDAEERLTVVESLLDAGADDTIKDKKGQRAIDAVPADDEDVRRLFRQAEASRKVDNRDIADDSDGEPGSGSGSDED